MDPEEVSGALPTDQTPGALAAGTEEEDDASIGLSKAEMAKIAAIQGDYYKTARDKLAAARTGAPSQSEKWFAIAAALGAPTKTGSFGEQLGGVNKALAEYSSQKREAEGKRQSLLDQIDLQQTKGLGDLQQKYIIEAARQRGLNERAGNKPINSTTITENGRPLLVKTYIDGMEMVDLSQNSPTFGKIIRSTRANAAIGGPTPAGGPPAVGAPMVAPAGGPPAVGAPMIVSAGGPPPPPPPPPPPVDLPPSLRRAPAQPAVQPVYAATDMFSMGQVPSFNVPGVGMVPAGSSYTGPDKKPMLMSWDGTTKALGDVSVADQLTFAKKKAEAEASVAGRRSMDVQFGKDYVTWTSNGRASAERQLTAIKDAITKLEAQDQNKPGAETVSGGLVALTPDKVRSQIGAPGLDLQQQVEGAIQLGLKNVLDSQFSEGEARMFLARAFDPRLGPKFNIKRLKAFRDEFESKFKAKDAMASYWAENSTLEGFKGPAMSSRAYPPPPTNPTVGPLYSDKDGKPITWVVDQKTNKGKFVYVR